MLKSVIVATLIGVLGGFWVALLNDSIEVFQNYVDGEWRYQVGVRSFAAPVIGIIIGALSGANIRLALAPESTGGFTRGALIGSGVGILLILAQVALVVLAANFGDYRVSYQPLLTRLSGILFAAAVIGAATCLLRSNRSLAPPVPGAVVGALTAAAFVLPNAAANALAIATSDWTGSSGLALFVTDTVASHLSTLLAGASSGVILETAYRRWKERDKSDTPADTSATAMGILLGAFAGVTASSSSFHYVVFGLFPSGASFSLALYVFRALVGALAGLLFGIAAGLFISYATQRIIATRGADADMISRD